ncbi:MAG: phage major capsid protein [Ignavibacteriae bacterium]|jgi:HK97 family phage major capsid protein|nr:phage major capsid protein [Ignavibacteriota bacterium]
MNERFKSLDDIKISAETDEQKIERIASKAAGDFMKKEIDEINKSIPGIPAEQFVSSENRANTAVQDGRNFLKGIIHNRPELIPPHYKSFLGEGSGSTGGNLVPQEWYNRIMSLVSEGGVAYRNATIFNLTRKELVIPRMDSMPGFNFVTEGAVKVVSNPTFSQVILSRKDGGFIVLFSRQLLEDEAFDLMGFVTQMAGKILMLAIDRAAFRGLTPISGLLSNGIGATISEVAGDEFTAMTYDDLIAMVSAVPSHTLRNAKWYMNRTVYGAIKRLRYAVGGEYVLSPQDRKDLLLEGYPVELTDACPSMGESGQDKAFIGFGDLGYMALGMRNGLTVDFSKDATVTAGESTLNLWQSGLVGLNFGASFDVKFTFPSALSVLKTQAS